MSGEPTRRPLESRGKPWAAALSRRLTAWRIPPNLISALSVVFTAAAGVCLPLAARTPSSLGAVLLFLGAAAGIQLRLLANLMDGLVAVEGGLGSPTGELWNDLPDRFADALVFAGAAYAQPGFRWGVELGWTAAVLAVVTAYVRVLGAAAGAGQHFLGPMAKPQRMATMTVACLLAAAATLARRADLAAWALTAALALVVVGCAVTIARRLRQIGAELRVRAARG